MEQINTPALELVATIEDRQRLIGMKKEIEAQIDAHTATIKAELIAVGQDTYDAGDYTATLTVRERATLDKTELISQGVTTEQIKRATKVSTYVQLDIRARKA